MSQSSDSFRLGRSLSLLPSKLYVLLHSDKLIAGAKKAREYDKWWAQHSWCPIDPLF